MFVDILFSAFYVGLQRIRSGWIVISNEESFQQNSTIICNEIRDFYYGGRGYTCNNPPIRGRYVMIRQDKNSTENGFVLCEVQVLSCPVGFLGI